MTSATAIINVRVFDGHQLGEPATVVIDDGVIAAGRSADGLADVVDGGGGTCCPD
jgi:hypothetical protein